MNKNYLLIVISAIIIIGGLLLWQRGRFASETELNEVSQELEAGSFQKREDSGLEELSPNASTSTSSDSEITKELEDIEKDLNSLDQNAFAEERLSF